VIGRLKGWSSLDLNVTILNVKNKKKIIKKYVGLVFFMKRFSGILKNLILKIIKSNKLEKQSFGSNIKIRQIYALKFFFI